MLIRVLTFNVWNAEGDPQRMRLVRKEIEHLKPDLISFQEAIRSPDTDQLAELTRGLGFATTHQADMQHYTLPFFHRFGGAT